MTVLVIAAVMFMCASPLRAGSYTSIVSFGDSLTDTGNIHSATSNPLIALIMAVFFPDLDPPIPQAPYYERRFSNGPLWIDGLHSGLGLGPPIPSDDGGFNYAVGGAKTDSDNAANLFFPVDVKLQVDDYLSSRTPTGSELFVVEGGANDLLSGGQTDVTIPTSNLAGYVVQLYDAGGRHFLVPNLPPLGKIPSEVGTPDEAVLDARSIAFNNDLAARLDQIEAIRPDIMIFRVDFFGAMQRLLADPASFGFTNVTDAAFNEDTGVVVPNPNEYLFWDTIHPTGPAHAIIGAAAVQAVIPEPSTAAILALTLLGTTRRLRNNE